MNLYQDSEEQSVPRMREVHNRRDLKECSLERLTALLAAEGLPAFRARQLFAWMHRRLACDFAAMSDLPAELRATLDTQFRLTVLQQREVVTAPDGTTKYLFALVDGQCMETVAIPDGARCTVCVSTQVGCPFGCTFCASGRDGFVRHLTAAEIIDQVYRVQAALPKDARVTNVVFMGMGEPLSNYDAVLCAVRLLIHPLGLNIGQRHITISTVGIIPGIERLAGENLQVNLALSLHAPRQDARARLVPIARKYDLDSLLAAVRQYVRRTGRKVTFEYTVVPGQNDSEADADALVGLVHGLQSLVNIIPLNPNDQVPLKVPHSAAELVARAERFVELLRARRVEAALRRSRGGEITGACGQLRLQANRPRTRRGGADVQR